MSRVLVVTGMHRSGTSLVANYLQHAGLDMGAEFLQPDVGNPHGYYEDVLIHDLHREILVSAGIADSFTVTDDDLPLHVDATLVERAKKIADARPKASQWGWKEPRTSLFCDLWHEVVPDAKFLFLFRDPLAVLDSLLRRAAQESIINEPVLALVTWRIYNTELVRFAKAFPDISLVWETERFVERPAELGDVLRSRFGFELSDVPIDEVLVEDAYHRNVRMRARAVTRRNRAEAKACERLYHELQELASRRD